MISGLIFASYAWSFFATVTARPGLNGNRYYYYKLSRTDYLFYDFLVAIIALLICLRLLIFLFQFDKKKLTKTFIHFLYFTGLIIICEIYLSTRFVGKGWPMLKKNANAHHCVDIISANKSIHFSFSYPSSLDRAGDQLLSCCSYLYFF